MSKKFYTGDHHFHHWNIINYCNRPFEDAEVMNDELVSIHNEIVGHNDEVYFLGDVSFYAGKAIDLLERMAGRKHYIIGNHDAKKLAKWDGWESVDHYKEIKDKGRRVVLMHYPIASWHGMRHGWIHLHGHSHGTGDGGNTKYLRADVGVDVWNYGPVELDQIFATYSWDEKYKKLRSREAGGREM